MAKRRMFSKDVIETDWFTDMPATTQLLYVHLSMEADDDGFVASTKMAMVNAHASADDLAILVAKNYVILMEEKLYLIKHWRQNNYIQNDRYIKSNYADRLAEFTTKSDGSYTLKNKSEITNIVSKNGDVSKVYPECIQNVSKMDTQVRLGKDRLGKVKYKLVKTSKKQSQLLLLLFEVGFLDETELDDNGWDDLLDEFVKARQQALSDEADGYLDAKVKVRYVLNSISKTCMGEPDRSGKPTYHRELDPEAMATIQSKYAWLKGALEKAVAQQGAACQARNGGRIVADDAPHATDADVDDAFKELFGGDYEPKAS